MLHENLLALRKLNQLTQEEVAEKIGVSRQAVAKWENGLTVPDVYRCAALAKLYDVTVDELLLHEDDCHGAMMPPRGKHLFGTVRVGEKGQIVIPKKARDVFGISPGDELLMLGDEEQGLALVKSDEFLSQMERVKELVSGKDAR